MNDPGKLDQYAYLLPGEKLESITPVEDVSLNLTPSSVMELWRLDRVSPGRNMGQQPVLAALPLDGHEDDPNFRLYEAIFGRDSLRVALDLIDRYPDLTRNTLKTLAENQGIKYDAAGEEEPGRIPHEIRDPKTDEIAQILTKENGWAWPYYGAVDTTPEFVRVLAKYCRKSTSGKDFLRGFTFMARDGKTRNMEYALGQALNWICKRMDANPEGLVEFKHANPLGIENQVWRDSWDSYFHADGTIANHEQPIASVDVQRVTFDALLDAADVYADYLGDIARATELRERADKLRQRIMELFWTKEKNGYFVLGTDRDQSGKPRQLKVRTSDMGHLLHSRLLRGKDPDITNYREAILRQLFSKEMIGLNGIRTVATDEVRYRPGAYHNGSVWIWTNYLIIQGLALNGYNLLANFIATKLLNDTNLTRRFPEYLRGDNDPTHRLNTARVVVYDSRAKRENVVEQSPQDVQAWSVAAILGIKLHESVEPKSTAFDNTIEGELLNGLSG
ncbi:MAG TPA: hypothetical protein VMR95_04090 [Candidatus Binatia bacterium]|nr:hypothetical protein [Candidatus Binatia bacterium]